ncbi:putative cytochrome P450 [Aspergillus recurvatus]
METRTLETLETLATFLANNAYSVVATGISFYCTSLIYRLYFHPLAGFPGPKLAAATRWYEFYYDVIQRGTYVYKVEEMHEKYGPIVRINPHEIVIKDADFYNQVYVAGNTRRTERWARYATGVGVDGKSGLFYLSAGSHVMTVSHEHHRLRRKPLEPFFSRLGIDRIEPLIIEEAKLLNDRLQSSSGSGRILRLDYVFSAFAGDVITQICSEGGPTMMNNQDFGKDWDYLLLAGTKHLPLFMHFPVLTILVRMMPTALLLRLLPAVASFKVAHELATSHVIDAKRESLSLDSSEIQQDTKSSLFRHILSPPSAGGLPDSERDTERLTREAMVLFGAGTVTTARTLNLICYYILSDGHMRERLAEELRSVMARYPTNMPTWQELERLPYLYALVREGLSYGVMRRLPRVFPDTALHYKQWTIPPGTPVGMAAYSLHTDPEVYPEPFKFRPERWLGQSDPSNDMNRNWVAFSRGSRSCLGMNLAYAEMYWALAVLFRPDAPKLELFETEEKDVEHVVDTTIALPRLDSRGARVKVC